jgi:hypothetical protein
VLLDRLIGHQIVDERGHEQRIAAGFLVYQLAQSVGEVPIWESIRKVPRHVFFREMVEQQLGALAVHLQIQNHSPEWVVRDNDVRGAVTSDHKQPPGFESSS